jgi:hypothetical protein
VLKNERGKVMDTALSRDDARELAIEFIESSILRGYSIETIASGMGGYYGRGLGIQISGWCGKPLTKMKPNCIGVWTSNECYIFTLIELKREILKRLANGATA